MSDICKLIRITLIVEDLLPSIKLLVDIKLLKNVEIIEVQPFENSVSARISLLFFIDE